MIVFTVNARLVLDTVKLPIIQYTPSMVIHTYVQYMLIS